MDNNSDRHLQLNLPLDNQELSLEEAAQQLEKYFRQLYLRFPIREVNNMIVNRYTGASLRFSSELREERRKKLMCPS